jgi:hypothetical protein
MMVQGDAIKIRERKRRPASDWTYAAAKAVIHGVGRKRDEEEI